jgi:hypothetical protein
VCVLCVCVVFGFTDTHARAREREEEKARGGRGKVGRRNLFVFHFLLRDPERGKVSPLSGTGSRTHLVTKDPREPPLCSCSSQ